MSPRRYGLPIRCLPAARLLRDMWETSSSGCLSAALGMSPRLVCEKLSFFFFPYHFSYFFFFLPTFFGQTCMTFRESENDLLACGRAGFCGMTSRGAAAAEVRRICGRKQKPTNKWRALLHVPNPCAFLHSFMKGCEALAVIKKTLRSGEEVKSPRCLFPACIWHVVDRFSRC